MEVDQYSWHQDFSQANWFLYPVFRSHILKVMSSFQQTVGIYPLPIQVDVVVLLNVFLHREIPCVYSDLKELIDKCTRLLRGHQDLQQIFFPIIFFLLQVHVVL